MSTLPETVAILTGDLVNSSALPGDVLRDVPALMSDIARQAKREFGRAVVPRMIDVFRGDSWQWLVTDPTRALRLAIHVRASLRSRLPDHEIDTRVAIGIGAVESMPPTRISQGHGPAFEASGHALETLPKRRRLVVSHAAGLHAPALEDACVGLIDWLASGWTAAQARAVAGALAGHTQEAIAGTWAPPVTQAVVARHLARAGWDALGSAVEAHEKAVTAAHSRPCPD